MFVKYMPVVHPTEQLLAHRLLVLSQRLNRGVEVLLEAQLALSVRQWRVLIYLANHAPDSIQAIADFCRYDKSQVSRAVSELIERKLLRSRPCPDDGRRSLISLTTAGRRVYEQGVPLSLARQKQLTATLTPEELKAFEQTLDKLTRQADQLLQHAQHEKARRQPASE